MKHIVKKSMITLLALASLRAAATTPSSWKDLVGAHSKSYFVGMADSSPRGSFPIAFHLKEESVLKTPDNPMNPERFQGYALQEDGFHYRLQFTQGKEIRGVLRDFEQECNENGETGCVFSDSSSDYSFKVSYDAKKNHLKMHPTYNGKSHALVELNVVDGLGFMQWAKRLLDNR